MFPRKELWWDSGCLLFWNRSLWGESLHRLKAIGLLLLSCFRTWSSPTRDDQINTSICFRWLITHILTHLNLIGTVRTGMVCLVLRTMSGCAYSCPGSVQGSLLARFGGQYWCWGSKPVWLHARKYPTLSIIALISQQVFFLINWLIIYWEEVEPHLAVHKGCTWLCAQEWPLTTSRDHMFKWKS